MAQRYGLICAHEMARRHTAKDRVLVHTSDIHPYWHLTKKRFNEHIMTIQSPLKAVSKGRPWGIGGPFGNEEAISQAHGLRTALQTGIAAVGRRIYSSWEQSGPDLEALDEADSFVTQSSIPCIGLGTPVLSPGAGTSISASLESIMASLAPAIPVPATPVPATPALATPVLATPAPAIICKRAGTESQGRQGGVCSAGPLSPACTT